MSDSASGRNGKATPPRPTVGRFVDHPQFGRGRIEQSRRGGSQLLIHFLDDGCQRWVLSNEVVVASNHSSNSPQPSHEFDSSPAAVGTVFQHPFLGRGEVLQRRLNGSELLVRFLEDGSTRWIQLASKQSSESPAATGSAESERSAASSIDQPAELFVRPTTQSLVSADLPGERGKRDVGGSLAIQEPSPKNTAQEKRTEGGAPSGRLELTGTGSVDEKGPGLPTGRGDIASKTLERLLASHGSPMKVHEIIRHLGSVLTTREILLTLRNVEKFRMLNDGHFVLVTGQTQKRNTEGNNSTLPAGISEPAPISKIPKVMPSQSLKATVSSSVSSSSALKNQLGRNFPPQDLASGCAERRNRSGSSPESTEHSARPSSPSELRDRGSEDCQEREDSGTIQNASSMTKDKIAKDEGTNEEDTDKLDPSFTELINHFWLSARAKKVLRENVSSIQELVELDSRKLAAFTDCGTTTMQEIMELVRNIDPEVARKFGGDKPSRNRFFDDRMITLSDTPPCEENLNLLPIFSSEKIEYFSEDELHPGYKGGARISELPLSSRLKRNLSAMGFTTLGKLLLAAGLDLLEYRYFQHSDLKEVQKVIRETLTGAPIRSSNTVASSSTSSRVVSTLGSQRPSLPSRVPIADHQIGKQESTRPTRFRQTDAADPDTLPSKPVNPRREEHLPDMSAGEASAKAGQQRCAGCQKLLTILEEILVRNKDCVSLFVFIERIKGFCNENCISKGFPSPVVDRSFISKLFARNRNLYLIKGDYIVSKESLRSTAAKKPDRLPSKSSSLPAFELSKLVVGNTYLHPKYGKGRIKQIRKSGEYICIRFDNEPFDRWIWPKEFSYTKADDIQPKPASRVKNKVDPSAEKAKELEGALNNGQNCSRDGLQPRGIPPGTDKATFVKIEDDFFPIKAKEPDQPFSQVIGLREEEEYPPAVATTEIIVSRKEDEPSIVIRKKKKAKIDI